MAEPRRWTLSEREGRSGGTLESTEVAGVRVKPENECSFTDEILTRVIEEDPVLDLLERAASKLSFAPPQINRAGEALPSIWLRDEIEALLRACGRLNPDG